MFKKHNFIKYGRSADIISIEIKDSSDNLIDHFRCNNNQDYAKIIKILKDKYGFEPEIGVDESINAEKEIDWLKSDTKW